MRMWSFALLTALLVLGATEAMAWLTRIFIYGEDADAVGDGRPVRTARAPAFAFAKGLSVHPFYGALWDFHDLNIGPSTTQRECALTVGLLGGSVADEVSHEFKRALFRHAMSLGSGVSPVWKNLAHGAWAQPQQVQALANMLANGTRFHIVVSLDGYNEMTAPPAAHYDGAFPFFPAKWRVLIGMTLEQRIRALQILALRDEQRALLGRRVYGSATFDLLRRWRLDRIDRLVVRYHHDLLDAGSTPYSLERYGPRRAYAPDEIRRSAAESWYRGARLMAGLATRHGAEYYHFLQPNQYVPGAKPLTDEELAKAFKPNSGQAEQVRQGYPLLQEYGRHLRELGVEFFDLSRIYADNRETLYKDDCCHLNKRGNQLLAAAMLRRIIEATDPDDGALYPDSESESCLRPYRSAVASIDAGEFGEPMARSVFDVYRKGRTLVYLKRRCTVDDMVDRFFLHFTRREGDAGSDNFGFTQRGAILDGETCVAIARLEDGLVHIHTGQRHQYGRNKWSVESGLPVHDKS